MNREIKFRVWGGDDYMSSPFTLQDIQSGKIQFAADCPIMQYTGLKDKNGKEIYEGDIVKRLLPNDCSSATLWVVYFGTWSYMRRPIDKELGFAFDSIDARSNCEAIGNIYENPELLTFPAAKEDNTKDKQQ